MKSQTLLILEDNFVMRQFLQNYFQSYFNVIATQNVKEASEWIEKSKSVDIIVCDLNLNTGEISGYDFIDYIRSTEFYKNTPLIILSSNDTSGDKIKAFKLGASDYVIKPFNPEELYLRMKKHLALQND